MAGLLGDASIRDLLRAVAAADEAHGAVSVAAVSGAFATSLLAKVAALPQTRSDSVEDRTRLLEAAVALSDLQEQLLETGEIDTAVKLFTARNMPHRYAAQHAERQAAIQLALQAAADVPLELMRLCSRGLRNAQIVAVHSSRAASADLTLGVALLEAAFNGARSNLEGKMSSLTDPRYVASVADEIASLGEEVAEALRAAHAVLHVPRA
jgi:formiminotetrahydrofolate cyclodeaminase